MLGSLISAGASLAGGLMGSKSSKDAAEDQMMANERNAALQREFAQNGITWKVNDAKRAGIHPLFALGAQTMPAAPSYVGGVADYSMANAVKEMGQDVGRAVHSTMSSDQRAERLMDLQVENQSLQNDLLRTQISSQIAKTTGQVGPPMPTSFDEEKPHPDVGFAVTHSGGLSPVRSQDQADVLEDDVLGTLDWYWRNRLVPFSSGVTPPNPRKYPLPEGFDYWKWDAMNQQFYPAKSGDRRDVPRYLGPLKF